MTGVRSVIFFAILSFMFTNSAWSRTDYEFIDISNPFLRKIPFAIPIFKPLSTNPLEKEASVHAADTLAAALNFSGYFKIMDRGAFLYDPKISGITAADINFSNWTTIGAELLVTGGVHISEDLVEMEFRLFDPFKGKLLLGKRYKGRMDDQRRMVLRFSSEIIYTLTGNKGVFDSKIAFVSTGTGNKEIYICDFDGHRPAQLTRTRNITLSPAWSYDGKWIAYTSYARGKPEICIRLLKNSKETVVAQKGINITPAWVPGKFELAATLSYSGDPEIYLLTGTGKIIKKLTNNWGIDVSPAWSPDGKKMAFVSNRSGNPQIYVMDVKSGRVERLTFRGRYNTTPSWSPQGDRIAYSSLENGHFDIFVIGLDGKEPMQLTRDAGDNEAPTWSPDGSLIAFSSTRDGRSRIYVMTAYGTDQRSLLSLPGEQSNPRWSPGGITY